MGNLRINKTKTPSLASDGAGLELVEGILVVAVDEDAESIPEFVDDLLHSVRDGVVIEGHRTNPLGQVFGPLDPFVGFAVPFVPNGILRSCS